MKLHTLRPAKGATKKEKRIGRGEASGHGGTSTKGNKGAQSRSGYKSKRGHEGGQMPIQRSIPKIGFKNNDRVEYKVFNLGQIETLVEKYALASFSMKIFMSMVWLAVPIRSRFLVTGPFLQKLISR